MTVIQKFSRPTLNYDWDRWLDGKRRRLQRGKHFTSQVGSMRRLVYAKAKARGKTVFCSVIDDRAIELQASE